MANYKSIIAYDGTDFQGFQRQKAGVRTVQSVLEDGLRAVGWEESSLQAAGRTDAGVHAKGQVIAYDLSWKHSTGKLTQALNANMPADVSVVSSESVEADFHPRFSARSRRYRYTLIVAPVRDPLRSRYSWRIWPRPNVEAMQKAAGLLIGEHDFAAFGTAPIPGGHTLRTVKRADWKRTKDELCFEIEANAFLYRMVRRLVGALTEVGTGRMAIEEINTFLDDPSVRWEGPLAPAQGLCLEAVIYSGPNMDPDGHSMGLR
jgi:tRNA pseudouridine38-40 synthase